MRIPLHLKPYEPGESIATTQARVALHMDAMQLTGGRGFRQPSTKAKAPDAPQTRFERLVKVAFGEQAA